MIKILIVNDETNLLIHYKKLMFKLKEEGIQTEYKIETDSTKVLNMIKNKEFVPYLLITDLEMPILDGVKLSEEVKKLFPKINIVMITVHSSLQHEMKSYNAGVKNYITKPFKYEEFKELILKYINLLE